jgi:O-antigen ligase
MTLDGQTLSMIPSVNNSLKSNHNENSTGFVFFLFCIWAFVILGRPQDIFPLLGKFRPALLLGIATMGFVALQLKALPGPALFQERQIKYYTALVLIMVLGVPWSLYARLSFMLIFTVYINVILFVIIFYKLVSSVQRLFTVILIGCLGNGLYSAFAVVTGSFGFGRLFFGEVFDPNDLAFFALGFLPLNLVFISRDNPIWVRLACLFSFGSGVLLILQTGSRGGFLAFGIAAALLLLSRTKTIGFSFKAVFIFIFVAILCLVPIDAERYMTLLSLQDDYNVHDETGRLDLWKIGVNAMFDNPFTGVGVGNFPMAVGLVREARSSGTLAWQAPHNSFIQIGTETGIAGLALFFLMSLNVFLIFKKVNKSSMPNNLTKIGEMGFIGFTGLFVSGMFLSQAYSFYWAFYIVLSAVINQLLIKKLKSDIQKQA